MSEAAPIKTFGWKPVVFGPEDSTTIHDMVCDIELPLGRIRGSIMLTGWYTNEAWGVLESINADGNSVVHVDKYKTALEAMGQISNMILSLLITMISNIQRDMITKKGTNDG
jgi:hypothetical protein